MAAGVNDIFTQKLVGSIVRHGLTAAGGYLISAGAIDQKGWEEASAGLAVVLVSLIWSFYQKHHNETVIQAALEMPKGSTRKEVEAKVKSTAAS